MIPFTTLKQLRNFNACTDRYNHLKTALGENYGDDTPIPLVKILGINGLNDALWIPELGVSGDNITMRYRLFAVACCHDILHLMTDPRSVAAVKIAHLFAHGEATKEELAAARDAAGNAADAAGNAAWSAARSAARSAAGNAADAAWSAADAADAAGSAAWSAAGNAAWSAARSAAENKQTNHFDVIFGTEFE